MLEVLVLPVDSNPSKFRSQTGLGRDDHDTAGLLVLSGAVQYGIR